MPGAAATALPKRGVITTSTGTDSCSKLDQGGHAPLALLQPLAQLRDQAGWCGSLGPQHPPQGSKGKGGRAPHQPRSPTTPVADSGRRVVAEDAACVGWPGRAWRARAWRGSPQRCRLFPRSGRAVTSGTGRRSQGKIPAQAQTLIPREQRLVGGRSPTTLPSPQLDASCTPPCPSPTQLPSQSQGRALLLSIRYFLSCQAAIRRLSTAPALMGCA